MKAKVKPGRFFLAAAFGAGAVFFSVMRPPAPDFGDAVNEPVLEKMLSSHEPVLVLIYADWCADCPAFAKRLRGPDFAEATSRFKKIEYDATNESAWGAVSRLGIDSVPALIAVEGGGRRVLPAYSKIPAGILEAFLRGTN